MTRGDTAAQDQDKAKLKARADEGRLMLELVSSSRTIVEHKAGDKKNTWTATVSAYVDGGKKLTVKGRGSSKGGEELFLRGRTGRGVASDTVLRRLLSIGFARMYVLRAFMYGWMYDRVMNVRVCVHVCEP